MGPLCRSGSIIVLYFLIYIMIALCIERYFLWIDRDVATQYKTIKLCIADS